jgi:putative hydrolase of the HAD superfamily
MRNDFDAVTFDLDGTLYPNYRLNVRLIPFVLREWPLLVALGKARDTLRAGGGNGGNGSGANDGSGLNNDDNANDDGGFYDIQARLMAGYLKKDVAYIREKTEKDIYRGWEPLFKTIKAFPHVAETLTAIKGGGFRLGLLSDFPPDRKLAHMGLSGMWDAVCCSEKSGALKPAPLPFIDLARALSLPLERILYVGNSVRYDIIGAKAAGMKAALVCSPLKPGRCSQADFVFHDYRQLQEYVLG